MSRFNLNKSLICAVVVCIMATVVEAIFGAHHGEAIWERVPGADVVIGLVGAGLLVFLAKMILARILQKKEDYYGEEDE